MDTRSKNTNAKNPPGTDDSLESTVSHHTPISTNDNLLSGSDYCHTGVETIPERYRLVQRLGTGGYGEVWQARDEVLERDVAVKIPRPERKWPIQLVDQFLNEARTLAKLQHPNILMIFDFGVQKGGCFVVSQLASPQTLAGRFSQETISLESGVSIVQKVALGLHHAHLNDIVHRDIKPANIFFDQNDEPMLGDFGLAIQECDQLSERPAILGTYKYMSPEQAKGQSHMVDGRSDIFSLGVVLYELLVGRVPFLGHSPEEYLDQVCEREPRPLRTIDDAVPPELERICLKCLRRDPAERYTSARDLSDDLNWFLDALAEPNSKKRQDAKLSRRSVLSKYGWPASLGLLTAAAWHVWVKSPQKSSPKPFGPSKRPNDAFAGIPKLKVREIEWARKNAVSWDVVETNNALRVFSDDVALISFGEYTGGSSDFSVAIHQQGWQGGLGLFFGCQNGSDDFLKCHTIEIEKTDSRNYQIVAKSLVLPLERDSQREISTLAVHPLKPLGSKPCAFQLRFEGRDLTHLAVHRTDQSALLQRWRFVLERVGRRSDSTGGFGIVCHSTSLSVSKPIIDGKERQFV